jgi:hypothetical protein
VSDDQLIKDYQDAQKNFRVKYAWYMERLSRKMKIYEIDTQDIQGAWDAYAKLRKQIKVKLEGD